MAEENSVHDNAELFSHDDATVMRVLLHTVKGLSPISVAPALESVSEDDRTYSEQFQFE